MLTPDRIVSTTCPYCGVGCNLQLHIKDDFIYRVTSPHDAVVNQGNLCVKGRFGYDFHVSSRPRHDAATSQVAPTTGATHPGFQIVTNGARRVGMRRWTMWPIAWWKSTGAMDPKPWPSTAAPRPPTKTTI